jgi:CheY-like chemotaxis protein
MPAEVLVVDDNRASRLFLTTLLPRYGFRVRTAADGEEAVRLYRRHRATVDLVLMDVQMPRLNGPQALAALRSLDPAVRCCLMSADAGDYSPEQLLALGATAFLEKPFLNPDAVARLLWACLGRKPEGLSLSA